MLLRLRFIHISIMLLALSGCASIPNVEPPDPMHLNGEGQVLHFEGATPDRVLAAAETVLQQHRPEGRFNHKRDAVVMEYEWWIFLAVFAGYELERWVVVAREAGDVTAASVAMGYATEGYVWPFTGVKGNEYPQAASWYAGPEIRVDYGMFWKRVRSVLMGDPWPECEKVKYERGYRYYEPLCRHKTVNRSDAD